MIRLSFTEIDCKSQFFKTDSTDIYNLSVETFIYLKHGTKKNPNSRSMAIILSNVLIYIYNNCVILSYISRPTQ